MHDTSDWLTIKSASQLLDEGKISARELVQHFLERIERYDGRLNSFVLVTRRKAIRMAEAADREIRSGSRRGPLHGIPLSVKDVYEMAGTPTTAGSRIFGRNTASKHSTAVARLESHGAVLLGKTATDELTHGGIQFDLAWPPARNPWDTGRDPGGSSSGSAVAISAGLCLGALGTDTGGSIRVPGALCGIVGLKPTFGRVSRQGVMLNSETLDHCGPMAWTAFDCAVLLQAIAGSDALDPFCSAECVPDYVSALAGDLAGVRIGVVRHFWEEDTPASAEMASAIVGALDVLKSLNTTMRDVRLKSLKEYNDVKVTIQRPEIFSLYGDAVRGKPESFGKRLRDRMVCYDAIPAVEYVKAQTRRRELTAHMFEIMRDLDALVTIVASSAAALIEEAAVGAPHQPTATVPFNVTGFPALTCCIGYTDQGLPLAMQIVGKPFKEEIILKIADAYEQATASQKIRPSLLTSAGESNPELMRGLRQDSE